MGLPVTERGGPPGGGGIGRPDALVGGRTGADEGGDVPGAAGVGAAGAAAGASGTPADGAGCGRAGAGRAVAGAAGAAAAGATGAGRGAAGGAGAAGDWTAGAAGGAGRGGMATEGCSEAGRLVISRVPARFCGGGVAAAAAGRAGVRSPPDRGSVVGSPVGAPGVAFLATAFFAGASFAGGAGSSGWTSRRRPSRSAFLRARSACASSMDDEWLLTPIPRDRQRSRASLLVRPSSWASS